VYLGQHRLDVVSLYNRIDWEVYMSKKIYSILVIGSVERRVIVSGGSLAEAEANAYSEWTNLTGGHIGTAECIEAHELEDYDNV
jgi:hypothetical protein